MRVAGRVGDVQLAPEAPILIYDASCTFCRKWVFRVKRLDRRDLVRLVPMQDPTAEQTSGRSRAALEQAAHFVRPDGAVFAGAAAAREFFRYVPGGWLVRFALSMPGAMPVAERIYAWIARRWGPVR